VHAVLFGPYRRQRWRYVWPGAVLATIFWLLATAGFAWYVRNIGHYNVMYGSVGAGIALLVWMYLMAVIALIGCEFNAETGIREGGGALAWKSQPSWRCSVLGEHLLHALPQRRLAVRTTVEHVPAGVLVDGHARGVAHHRHLVHGQDRAHEGA
jgi:hypothetical protein